MSPYELRRWRELEAHWEKKAARRQLVPARARKALSKAGGAATSAATKTASSVVERTPENVRQWAESAVDVALVPTVRNVVHLLELLNDWVVELSDPDAVLRHHQEQGRNVSSLGDLKRLDLRDLDAFTDGMALRWRTLGAGQGASFGALAMIPVPVLGSAVAIGFDLVAMQALTAAIATRVAYAYGFDAAAPETRHMIDRMVNRGYRNQTATVGAVRRAGSAFEAARDRVNWSQRLREDHRLMAAVEKLLKRVGDGSRVSVKNARMGMPVIGVLAGAATNSFVLGDTVTQARHYSATVLLAEKHGLPLPSNLHHDLEEAESSAGAEVIEPDA